MPTTRTTASDDATAYALLGLLSVRAWTTYELAQQVRRSLHWFWPRAERKLYDDPKRLASQGLATASEEYTGRRRRTVYAITAKGRRELRAWLASDSPGPSWENQALVKVFFADAGDLETLRVTLARMRDAARARLVELARKGAEPPPVPARAHLNAISIRLQQELEETQIRWAEWALEQTAGWPASDDPGAWDVAAVYARLAEAGERASLS